MVFLTILGDFAKNLMRIAILSMMALIIFTILFKIVGFNEAPYAEVCLFAISVSTGISIEVLHRIFRTLI
jgi:hypothetical protein